MVALIKLVSSLFKIIALKWKLAQHADIILLETVSSLLQLDSEWGALSSMV